MKKKYSFVINFAKISPKVDYIVVSTSTFDAYDLLGAINLLLDSLKPNDDVLFGICSVHQYYIYKDGTKVCVAAFK